MISSLVIIVALFLFLIMVGIPVGYAMVLTAAAYFSFLNTLVPATGRLDLLGFSDTWNGDGRRGVMSVPAFPGLIFYRYFRWFLPA